MLDSIHSFCSTVAVSECGIVYLLQEDSEKQSIKRESSLEPDSSPSSPKVSLYEYLSSNLSLVNWVSYKYWLGKDDGLCIC